LTPMINHYAYPTSAMIGDYLRAAAGLVPTVAVFATIPVGAVSATVLAAFATLFAVFGIRTALRHGTRLEMTPAALRASGLLCASINWDRLDYMKLAYYSTRRDRRDGWMQLELRSGRSTLRVDSRLEGFSELVERSAGAAETRGLPLNPATLANLQALGVGFHDAEGGMREAAGARN